MEDASASVVAVAKDDATSEEEIDMVVATSARASRAARPPCPSNRDAVVGRFHALEAELQRRSLLPFTSRRTRHRYHTSATGTGSAGQAWRHMISIHSRSIDTFFRDQQHVAFLHGHSPRITELIRIGIRYSSVRVSLVYQKSMKVAGAKMGSSQQTTRVNVHPVCTAWAAQSVAVATTLGMVSALSSKTFSDPRSAHSRSPRELMEGSDRVFVVAATSRMASHALPTRLVSSSLLATMRELATSEVMHRMISVAIRQPEGSALQGICRRIVDDSSAGDSIWASLALLSYMQSEPAGRRMLGLYNISDIDAAVASTFLAYGRSEITRRSRLTDLQLSMDSERRESSRVDKNSTTRIARYEQMTRIDDTIETMIQKEMEHDEQHATPTAADHPMYHSDPEEAQGDEHCGAPGVVGAERRLGRPPSTLPHKSRSRSKGHPLSGCTPHSEVMGDDVRSVLTQKRKRGCSSHHYGTMRASALALVFWDAALKSQHAHVLLMLLASSKSAAQKAADATVRSQVIEQDLLSNEMLRKLSEENAVKSAVALRTTVMQSCEETPLLCAWREHGSCVRVGIARSKDDLSTCTLYACSRADCAPRPDAHMAIAWTESYYHATPSAITAPFPGITESLEALARHEQSTSGRQHVNVARVVKESGKIRESLRGTLTSMTLTGITRGILCMKCTLVVPSSQLSVAKKLSGVCEEYLEKAVSRSSTVPAVPGEILRPLSTDSLQRGSISEPYTTPANNLIVALEASETVRALSRGRSHCGDPTKAFFGFQTPRELSESFSHDFDRPSSLLPIVDVATELRDDVGLLDGGACLLPRMSSRPDALHVPMYVQLVVSGNAPVRAPEAVACVASTRPYEARAMLFVAASTASLLGETVVMSCAGALNTAAAAAKRVIVADVNKRLFATPYQVYVKGDRNVKPSFVGTAWEGDAPAPRSTRLVAASMRFARWHDRGDDTRHRGVWRGHRHRILWKRGAALQRALC